MRGSWRIGTAFGIGIYIHWSFLILPGLVLAFTYGNLVELVFSELLIASIFGCVVLHELGHALMARKFGIPTLDITLLPIGGVARLGKPPQSEDDGQADVFEKPSEEFWIALAGPAVNVVIAAILAGLLALTAAPVLHLVSSALGPDELFQERMPFLQQYLAALLTCNLALVAFNMLPAFPMDGGRVLRSVLAMAMNRLQATEFAASIGTVVAWGLVFHPVVFGMLHLFGYLPGTPTFQPMLSLVGMFVYFVGQQELAGVRQREADRLDPQPHDLPSPTPYLDRSAIPPEANFSGFTWDRRAQVWIEWRNGQPIHTCWPEHPH